MLNGSHFPHAGGGGGVGVGGGSDRGFYTRDADPLRILTVKPLLRPCLAVATSVSGGAVSGGAVSGGSVSIGVVARTWV